MGMNNCFHGTIQFSKWWIQEGRDGFMGHLVKKKLRIKLGESKLCSIIYYFKIRYLCVYELSQQ